MLSRIISRSSNSSRFLTLTLIAPSSLQTSTNTPNSKPYTRPTPNLLTRNAFSRHFSSDNGGDHNSDFWKISSNEASKMGSLFDESTGLSSADTKDVDADGDWLGQDEFKPWSLGDEADENLFDLGDCKQEIDDDRSIVETEVDEVEKAKENQQLELEKQQLTAVLKGPNRAFGDLVAASGITDEMLDSLMALKDFSGVDGLPPLKDIEEWRYQKTTQNQLERKLNARNRRKLLQEHG